jgi:hypothetical protein
LIKAITRRFVEASGVLFLSVEVVILYIITIYYHTQVGTYLNIPCIVYVCTYRIPQNDRKGVMCHVLVNTLYKYVSTLICMYDTYTMHHVCSMNCTSILLTENWTLKLNLIGRFGPWLELNDVKRKHNHWMYYYWLFRVSCTLSCALPMQPSDNLSHSNRFSRIYDNISIFYQELLVSYHNDHKHTYLKICHR